MKALRRINHATIFIISILFFCCTKDHQGLNTTLQIADEQLIAAAKADFENSITNANSSQTQSLGSKMSWASSSKSADWKRAYTLGIGKLSDNKVVIVPVNFDNGFFYKVAGKQIDLSAITRLYVFTDKKGAKQIQVVTRIPDEDYLNNAAANKRFTGVINVQDWQGNFIKGWRVTLAKVYGLGAPENHPVDNNTKLNVVNTNDIYCYSYPYGHCSSYDGGANWDCVTYGYSTECYGSDVDSDEPAYEQDGRGNTTTPSGGGGGGGNYHSVDMSNVSTGASREQKYPGSCVFKNMDILGKILGLNLNEVDLLNAYAGATNQRPEDVQKNGIKDTALSYSVINDFVNQYFNTSSVNSSQIAASIDDGKPLMAVMNFGSDTCGNNFCLF